MDRIQNYINKVSSNFNNSKSYFHSSWKDSENKEYSFAFLTLLFDKENPSEKDQVAKYIIESFKSKDSKAWKKYTDWDKFFFERIYNTNDLIQIHITKHLNDIDNYSERKEFNMMYPSNIKRIKDDFIIVSRPTEGSSVSGTETRNVENQAEKKSKFKNLLVEQSRVVFQIPFDSVLLQDYIEEYRSTKSRDRNTDVIDYFFLFLIFSQFATKMVYMQTNQVFIPRVYLDQILISRIDMLDYYKNENNSSTQKQSLWMLPEEKFLIYYPKCLVHYLSCLYCEDITVENIAQTFLSLSDFIKVYFSMILNQEFPLSDIDRKELKLVTHYYSTLLFLLQSQKGICSSNFGVIYIQYRLLLNFLYLSEKILQKVHSYQKIVHIYEGDVLPKDWIVPRDEQEKGEAVTARIRIIFAHRSPSKIQQFLHLKLFGFKYAHFQYCLFLYQQMKELESKVESYVKVFADSYIHNDTIKIFKEEKLSNIQNIQSKLNRKNEDKIFEYQTPIFFNINFYEDYTQIVHFVDPNDNRYINKIKLINIRGNDEISNESTVNKEILFEFYAFDLSDERNQQRICNYIKTQTTFPLPEGKLFVPENNQQNVVYLRRINQYNKFQENSTHIINDKITIAIYLEKETMHTVKRRGLEPLKYTKIKCEKNLALQIIKDYVTKDKYIFYEKLGEYGFKQFRIIDIYYEEKEGGREGELVVVENYDLHQKNFFQIITDSSKVFDDQQVFRLSRDLCDYLIYFEKFGYRAIKRGYEPEDNYKNEDAGYIRGVSTTENRETNSSMYKKCLHLSEHTLYLDNKNNLWVPNMYWSVLCSRLGVSFPSKIFRLGQTTDNESPKQVSSDANYLSDSRCVLDILRFAYVLKSRNKKEKYNSNNMENFSECSKEATLEDLRTALNILTAEKR